MQEEEIRAIFKDVVTVRNWQEGTSINRFQAYGIKRRFAAGDLSVGRMVEILMECGYRINITKE